MSPKPKNITALKFIRALERDSKGKKVAIRYINILSEEIGFLCHTIQMTLLQRAYWMA
jgi:hypothetical protein